MRWLDPTVCRSNQPMTAVFSKSSALQLSAHLLIPSSSRQWRLLNQSYSCVPSLISSFSKSRNPWLFRFTAASVFAFIATIKGWGILLHDQFWDGKPNSSVSASSDAQVLVVSVNAICVKKSCHRQQNIANLAKLCKADENKRMKIRFCLAPSAPLIFDTLCRTYSVAFHGAQFEETATATDVAWNGWFRESIERTPSHRSITPVEFRHTLTGGVDGQSHSRDAPNFHDIVHALSMKIAM